MWTIVVLPDTQHYAEDYPSHFYRLTSHVAYEVSPDLVLHVGDVVDDNQRSQWDVADEAFSYLDEAGIPYVLSAGNHDFAYDSSRDSLYSEYFPAERLGLASWVPYSGRSENGFRILNLGGEDWLILSLELFPRTEVLTWAMQVLDAYDELPTIIVTHAYLNADGLRYGEAGEHAYGIEAMHHVTGDNAHDAETIYTYLVEPFSQVQMVFSGHVLDGIGYRADTREDGSVAHQFTRNFQLVGEGGDGWFTVIHGYENQIKVRTVNAFTGFEKVDETLILPIP